MSDTQRKLGKLPARSHPNAIMFANYLPKKAVSLPVATNFWKGRAPLPARMFGNDVNGDCTRASQAIAAMRMERLEQNKTINIPDEEVIRVYYEMTAKYYGSGDTGAYEMDALNEWRREDCTFKDTKGRPYTIDAYARINQANITEVKTAIFTSKAHGVKACFNLPAAWMAEDKVWDIPEGVQPIGAWTPGSWGGHCLAGDTIIHLLDGTNVPIADLEGKTDVWVYGCLPNARPMPVMAKEVVKTKFAQTLQVNIDSGVSIRCTPEHLFMMRDGTYREARLLNPGDRLMPLRRIIHHRGYEKLKWYDEGRHQLFTHRMVGEVVHGCPKNKIVHHEDENKRNNDPSNLKLLTQAEHVSHHEAWKVSPTGLIHLRNKEVDLNSIPQDENHKILSVTEGKEEWVYDLINVSPTHNFAANGVFVHNSTYVEDYDKFGVIVPTWDIKVKISWRAFAIYSDESYIVIDSINKWKKKGLSKIINLNALKADVNAVSSQIIV